ncbi:hypothetical protein HK104_010155 [Borealophlyctis nickersoniae]|nr:hypothetical protein HK104_010155 [Borealophlyctis nickersoniae]
MIANEERAARAPSVRKPADDAGTSNGKPSRNSLSRMGRPPTHPNEADNQLLYSLRSENQELRLKLKERDDDCTLAATVGQTLLQEIEALRIRIRDLEGSSPAKLEKSNSNEHLRIFESEVETLSSSLKGFVGKLSRTDSPEASRNNRANGESNGARQSDSGDRSRSSDNSMPVPRMPSIPVPQNTIRRVTNKKNLKLSIKTRKDASPSAFFDDEFSAGIDDTILQHARTLQHRLAQSEAGRLETQERAAGLEKALETLKRQHEKILSKRAKLEERIWDLELANQQQKDHIAARVGEIARLNVSVRQLEQLNQQAVEQVEALKAQDQQRQESHEHVKNRLEAEILKCRRTILELQKENEDLTGTCDDLISVATARKFASRSTQSLLSRQIDEEDEDDYSDNPRSATFLTPDASPSKNSTMFVESLSASLAHAQMRVVELQDECGRMMDEKEELGKLLAEAQETIEMLREKTGDADGDPMVAELQERIRAHRVSMDENRETAMDMGEAVEGRGRELEPSTSSKRKRLRSQSSNAFRKPVARNLLAEFQKVNDQKAKEYDQKSELLDWPSARDSESAEEEGGDEIPQMPPPNTATTSAQPITKIDEMTQTEFEPHVGGSVPDTESPTTQQNVLPASESHTPPVSIRKLSAASQTDPPVRPSLPARSDSWFFSSKESLISRVTADSFKSHERVCLRLHSSAGDEMELVLYVNKNGKLARRSVPESLNASQNITAPLKPLFEGRPRSPMVDSVVGATVMIKQRGWDDELPAPQPQVASDSVPTRDDVSVAPSLRTEQEMSPIKPKGDRTLVRSILRRSVRISESPPTLVMPEKAGIEEDPMPMPKSPLVPRAEEPLSPSTSDIAPAHSESSAGSSSAGPGSSTAGPGSVRPQTPSDMLSDDSEDSDTEPGPPRLRLRSRSSTKSERLTFSWTMRDQTVNKSSGSSFRSDEDLSEYTLSDGEGDERRNNTIESLTYTMIGSYFHKYNRHNRNPQLRYFWINPYSRTLNWAARPPSQGKKNMQTKTAYIDSIQWDDSSEGQSRNYPPGPEHALTIRTRSRNIRVVATNWYDHRQWITGLDLLLKRSGSQTPLYEQFLFVDGVGSEDSSSQTVATARTSMIPRPVAAAGRSTPPTSPLSTRKNRVYEKQSNDAVAAARSETPMPDRAQTPMPSRSETPMPARSETPMPGVRPPESPRLGRKPSFADGFWSRKSAATPPRPGSAGASAEGREPNEGGGSSLMDTWRSRTPLKKFRSMGAIRTTGGLNQSKESLNEEAPKAGGRQGRDGGAAGPVGTAKGGLVGTKTSG